MGDYARAIPCLRKTIASLSGDRVGERFGWAALPAVTSRAYLVGCLAELGEFGEGIGVGEEAIKIAETANHPFSLGQALLNLGVLYLRKGELRLATALLERGPGLSGVSKVSALAAGIAAALGYARALSGRVKEGIPLLEAGVEQAGANRITARHSLWVAWLAEAYMLAGRGEDATALAARALALSREHNERGNLAYAPGARGTAAKSGPDADAGERLLAAIAEGRAQMRPLVRGVEQASGLVSRLGRIRRPSRSFASPEMMRSMGMTAAPLGSARCSSSEARARARAPLRYRPDDRAS